MSGKRIGGGAKRKLYDMHHPLCIIL